MAIKLKEILESIGLQRKTGVGSRYRAIVKRGDKYYYVQDDPLGNNIRQEFGSTIFPNIFNNLIIF